MAMCSEVSVQEADFDVGAEIGALSAGRPDVGAVASFVGLVRDVNDGSGVHAMTLEHYPGMTERAIAAMIGEAEARWGISGAMVIHRHGTLAPGEPIMMVATAARHRAEAFAAAEFLMDYLKSRAPFWKKEVTEAGATWVAARDRDEDALGRWDAPGPDRA